MVGNRDGNVGICGPDAGVRPLALDEAPEGVGQVTLRREAYHGRDPRQALPRLQHQLQRLPQADGGIRLGAGTGLAGRRAYVTDGNNRR